MSRRNKHVVPHGEMWAVRTEGAERVGSIYNTQGAAIEAAKSIAKRDHLEVVIHGTDGKIRDTDSYGNDPCPPKDKKY